MPDLKYGLSVVDRDRGNLPKIPVVNFFVEKSDVEDNPILQSRPGIETTGTVLGTGPVTALYQIDGVLNGQMFALSGSDFYSGATKLGSVAGTGSAKIAGFQNRVFVTSGTTLYEYNGTTFSAVTTPSNFNTRSLCIGSDRLIVIDDGTGHFYWSDVLSDNIQTLSFATAENSPDNLKDCVFVGDTLYLFGTETVEQWPVSAADPNLPYTPLVGRTIPLGIRDTGCVTAYNGTYAWITNHNQVCVGNRSIMGPVESAISNPSLEEKLSQSTTASLWRFFLEGVEFLAVRMDTETWVFSNQSSQWSTFESYGETNWIPQCYANNVFGSSIDGNLLQWSDDYSDLGAQLERRFRAGLPITNSTQPVYSLTLRTNPGQTPFLTGDYVNPVVEVRTSKDGGFTWGNWRARSLGTSGEYRKLVMWRSLGYFGFPSALFEFRVTDPVPFRISGVTANEPFGSIGDEE